MGEKKSKIVALIPARGGSKGIPHKNIKCLNGFPLIAYSIAACQMSHKIERIIVSTDSEEIAKIAKQYGAEVPFLRPKELAEDNSGDIEFVNHAINWFEEKEGGLPELFIHIRPTTPLRVPEKIDEAICRMQESMIASSLRSAHKASESPYKWFLKNENGFFESVAKDLSNDAANNGRQQFPDVYIPDGYVDVLKIDFIRNNGILHGEKMIAFESPMCYEVDTEEDFFLLNFQIEKQGSIIYNYLEQNYGNLRKENIK